MYQSQPLASSQLIDVYTIINLKFLWKANPFPMKNTLNIWATFLDPKILSNKHIDYVINKGRKRLDLLKYIAGRDWGADAGTLRLTYTSLIRPVLESELIAIDEALRIIKTMTSPDEIWILCDSRSAIQHLSDWTNVGDKTSVSILKNLKELSQQHEIYFQWITSHIGLFGNDTADLLAKEGVTEDLMSRRTLTFSEIFSKTKSLIQELWKTPPTHPWYNRQAPGGALSIKADRVVQTTISRLASGHIRGLSFNLGQKIYENCTKYNLVQATPDHLLFCAGLDREDIYSSPLLVAICVVQILNNNLVTLGSRLGNGSRTANGYGFYTPLSTASSGTAPTPCEELTAMKTYIRRLQIICNEKEKTVSLLRLDHGHDESDTLYQLAWNEFQDVQGTLQQAVSDFDSLLPCTNPGCSHLISRKNTPKSTPPPSPTRRNAQLKRKDEEDFEFPPLRKTARKTILEKSEDLILDNQFSLLPQCYYETTSHRSSGANYSYSKKAH
ncbi:putative RNA-directed DNA polymerase from transposon BS [Trichonephila clavipes]|nr:putative RNA-directed DNA polymerase from transposon BS [Trichonephila clavipes]